MDSYEINKETCAIIGVSEEVTKIIEKKDKNVNFIHKIC